ncbi:hypothetical protein COCSADRAFT_322144 [Bipolaris sorokiniana ND90Pr]|uniref:Uncharacterized protein n=1 Tax=Cochliobolus sativus (strain ND90Pr / ATCC 201652) TaxID=665912 RepID=M2SPF2_COCSN|nr:uncharacterized protein COCSADRAFT_322144 [Bipolaris sorokiniana ND90Pr]EMD64180.1 hypothetical protein COCSADRAFT_322144 [Bipolaris sorokiniana ND90Pr]
MRKRTLFHFVHSRPTPSMVDRLCAQVWIDQGRCRGRSRDHPPNYPYSSLLNESRTPTPTGIPRLVSKACDLETLSKPTRRFDRDEEKVGDMHPHDRKGIGGPGVIDCWRLQRLIGAVGAVWTCEGAHVCGCGFRYCASTSAKGRGPIKRIIPREDYSDKERVQTSDSAGIEGCFGTKIGSGRDAA